MRPLRPHMCGLDSKAILRNKLSDPYVKAFRFATDRLQRGKGVVCFVTNNGFISKVAFDGVRKHLCQDFNKVLHFNLKGDARTTGRQRQREGGNIFQDRIRVGIGITLLISNPESKDHELKVFQIDDFSGAAKKTEFLEKLSSFNGVPLTVVVPNEKFSWLHQDEAGDFNGLLPLGIKGTNVNEGTGTLFRLNTLGVVTNRDAYTFNFDAKSLITSMARSVDTYNRSVSLYVADGRPKKNIDSYADVQEGGTKWTRQTKASLTASKRSVLERDAVRPAMYRPFTKQYMYYSEFWNEEQYKTKHLFPNQDTENIAICVVNEAQIDFSVQAAMIVCSLHFGGRQTKCFSFYTYGTNGINRRENITDWALNEFRANYSDYKITKWNIFHATYAILHHPEYRTRYAANLKRELPRIPFPPDFHAFAAAGKRLMVPPHRIRATEALPPRRDRRPRSGSLLPRRKNEALQRQVRAPLQRLPPPPRHSRRRLRIPPRRTAPPLSGSSTSIASPPTPAPASSTTPTVKTTPKYILRLIGQVITVSLETQQIIAALPSLKLGTAS